MLPDLLCGLQNVVLSKRFNVENLEMVHMLNAHVNKNRVREGRPLGCNMNTATVIVSSGPYRLLPTHLTVLYGVDMCSFIAHHHPKG